MHYGFIYICITVKPWQSQKGIINIYEARGHRNIYLYDDADIYKIELNLIYCQCYFYIIIIIIMLKMSLNKLNLTSKLHELELILIIIFFILINTYLNVLLM